MKKNFKKSLITILITIVTLILLLFLIRFINHTEIDDVTPGIPCEQNLLEKIDVLWIVPNFNNTPISKNEEWCSSILSLNKTLGMHGVNHDYWEFQTDRTQIYLEEGIQEFEKCFGFKPEMFKPPQLKISKENEKLIESSGLKLKNHINQWTHKVYHCNDSDPMKNWMIDLF